MTPWYKSRFRRSLVDMHIEDWDERFLSRFDPETYVQRLREGHIGAPMLYLQSHVGLCYWPTKSGKMHAALNGREDAMRRLERLCHAFGMDVIAYYSLIYNNWAYEHHPEWRLLDGEGRGSREDGNRYGLCCPNNLDYRAFVSAQLKELCEYFEFEGIFLDMTFWPTICHCDRCKARFKAEYGMELPETIDWHDERWLAFQRARSAWLGEFARFATDEVHAHKPDCAVEHQYSPILHHWQYGVDKNIADASTYAGGDLYGGIAEQSFACKLYYGVTPDQPFEYMTSRCYPSLNEHTTMKSKDLLRLSVMTTFLHHGACLLIDAIDPSGTLDERVYRAFGEVFSEAEAYEKYLTTGTLAGDATIYFDLDGKYDPRAKGPIDERFPDRFAIPHLEAALGAANALRGHHIPYTVRTDWTPDGKVMILPDVPDFRLAKEALSFVEAGGKLYVSGRCPDALMEPIFGLKIAGETDEAVTYLAPTEAGEALAAGDFTREHPLAFFEKQALAGGEAKGEVLATLVLPYTDPAERRFASIHSNPPGRWTNRPAMVRARYGKGEAVWCACPLERPKREQHADLFARVIAELVGEVSMKADAPECVELIRFDAPEKGQTLVGLVNVQEGFHTIPVSDISLSVRLPKKPSAVKLLPDERELPFAWADGFATVAIQRLEQYAMLLIER